MTDSQNGKSNGLQVTSATKWRKLREEGVKVPLPSGFTARLRPVGIEELVRRGRIPDQLSGMAAEVVWAGDMSRETAFKMGAAALDLLNIVVAAAFMEPTVTLSDPTEDEISIDDIDLADKNFVFTFVTGPLAVLRSFREKQERDVEPVSHGDEGQ